MFYLPVVGCLRYVTGLAFFMSLLPANQRSHLVALQFTIVATNSLLDRTVADAATASCLTAYYRVYAILVGHHLVGLV